MALDHYVSQVHLKNFYSPLLNKQMYAIRKSDLYRFTTKASSVCRIEDGSTNSYLTEDRVIEDFLKIIEPKYNVSIEKIKTDRIDEESIFVVAGFVGYVLSCSPAGMRIQSSPLRNIVELVGKRLDARGTLPPPPSVLNAPDFTTLLDRGEVRVEIDPKYPQAIGIQSILNTVSCLGNFTWEILINRIEDSPFFTSDFPVAFEATSHPQIINKVIPLSPILAIRIHPNTSYDIKNNDFSFSRFRCLFREISRKEILEINRLIVRCAESLVFFQKDLPWVQRFVQKNSAYRVEAINENINTKSGNYIITRIGVAPFHE